ncbi:unnamed protein product [Adineta steineri]|uniref:G-protein coupled receptors family 1 profile domain-containing protein n=1 Tax=Adineta steineri TaxID=433720 RepID=A0A819W004_9BILA|nr:unnamed protein product [Adineta steineri]CAF4116434.1 unnamed protein product [Adineta steineri]
MADIVGQSISLYGYWLSVPLGFVGHICSLIIFSSKNLRQSSTGLLFIFLTLSDTLYLGISIRDFLTFTIKWSTLQSEYLCRFRTFIVSFSTVTSAWLLILIALDRWIRVHFPYRQTRICTQKVAIYLIIFVCVCSTLFASHVLQSEFSFTAPGSSLCGPARSSGTFYSIFYFNTWPILQLLITYMIPSCIMIICFVGVYSKLRFQQTLVVASTRKERMQRQMLILMVSSIICFIICTIPYAIYRIFYLRSAINSISPIVTGTVSTLMTMNYCYNFYVYCLTSQLFRQTFIQQLKRVSIWCKRQTGRDRRTVYPLPTINRKGGLPIIN